MSSVDSLPRLSEPVLPSPSTFSFKPRLPVDQIRGTTFVILSVILHSAANSSARLATHTFSISPVFISVVRGLSQAFVASLLLFTTLDTKTVLSNLDFRCRALLALRGLLGGLVLYFKYSALSALPVTIATALQCTTPFFTAIMAAFILAEIPSPRDISALVLTLLGAAAVSYSAPGDVTIQGSAILASLLSALFSSAAILVVRATALRVHFVLNVLCVSIATALIPIFISLIQLGSMSLVIADISDSFSKLTTMITSAIFAACGFAIAGTLCFNRGIQLLPAYKSALLRCFDIPFNFVAALFILGEMPSGTLRVTGCVFIVVSTYLTASKSSPSSSPSPLSSSSSSLSSLSSSSSSSSKST